MAYDEALAEQVRELVRDERGITEKRMFGGLAFLVNGNLAVGASGQGGLMVRVDPAETEALVADPHAERMVMRGRAMDGWLRVAVDAATPAEEVSGWVRRGVSFARSLPPKG